MVQETTYRYGPLERGGFALGLRLPQIAGLVIAGAIALALLNVGGFGSAVLALGVLGLAVAVVLLPVFGRTLQVWAPVALRFLHGQWSGQARFRAQVAQLGHVLRLPEGGLDPSPTGEPKSLPAELAGLELLEAELAQYDGALMGAVADRDDGTFTAVLRCQGQAFALLGAEDQEQRLAEYGGVLAALARDDSPLRRIAWIERTVPAAGDEMADYLMTAKRPDASLDAPPAELVSYFQLLNHAPQVAEDHELLVCVQIDTRRPSSRRALKRLGGGDLGALAVLAGEVGRIAELLDAAGIAVTGVLTRRGVAAAIRNAYDPWGRRQRQRSSPRGDDGVSDASAGPMARDEHWSHVATDSALHATLWVAEWPRIDVRATFLQPLLMQTRTTRTVAMVMDLVGPSKATRQVERAATEAATEASVRARVGQRTTQRQRQREESTHRRERELAQGHAEVRFAAFVSVSVPAATGRVGTLDDLEAAVSRVELEAKRAPLRLERLWGQQAEALTFTLPLCRGLR
ncbi:MAG: type VII secretion protein EccE [Actinomycetota bacterium]|nr:type VII secretion protein EccE [Actinomycetota bacterium]